MEPEPEREFLIAIASSAVRSEKTDVLRLPSRGNTKALLPVAMMSLSYWSLVPSSKATMRPSPSIDEAGEWHSFIPFSPYHDSGWIYRDSGELPEMISSMRIR